MLSFPGACTKQAKLLPPKARAAADDKRCMKDSHGIEWPNGNGDAQHAPLQDADRLAMDFENVMDEDLPGEGADALSEDAEQIELENGTDGVDGEGLLDCSVMKELEQAVKHEEVKVKHILQSGLPANMAEVAQKVAQAFEKHDASAEEIAHEALLTAMGDDAAAPVAINEFDGVMVAETAVATPSHTLLGAWAAAVSQSVESLEAREDSIAKPVGRQLPLVERSLVVVAFIHWGERKGVGVWGKHVKADLCTDEVTATRNARSKFEDFSKCRIVPNDLRLEMVRATKERSHYASVDDYQIDVSEVPTMPPCTLRLRPTWEAAFTYMCT